MSEKLEKLRADLARARERRIQLNNRIELLERRIAEAEKVEVSEMVRCANLTPEQLAALLRQTAGGGFWLFLKRRQRIQAEKEALDPTEINFTKCATDDMIQE